MTKFIVFAQVGEDVNDLKKKLTQVENDLIRFKNDLVTANKELEDKEKALTNVIHSLAHNYSHYTQNINFSTFTKFHFIFG
jgi:predicted  nucleic acid-binding Zn-ribbon protein